MPLLLGVLACALPPSSEATRTEEVSLVGDPSRAFTPDGDGFRAGVPERGLVARFDLGGAQISAGGEVVTVRTLGVAPALGACVDDPADPDGGCVRRLEYAGDGVTEWWASRADGFEQGWTLEAAPAVVETSIEGATVDLVDGVIWLDGPDGPVLKVEGLSAWDADGVALDAWFVATAGGFRVHVDDAGATYPIEIDPVYTTPSWTVQGVTWDMNFGASTTQADVNGDGYDDVIVGVSGHRDSLGRAYVYLGSAAGLSSTVAATLTGEAADSGFGHTMSRAGDVNGDGFDDVIIGAHQYGSNAGRVYLFHGGPSGLPTTPSTVLDAEAASIRFGLSVSGAGDVNADGYDDVIIGAPGHTSNTGRAYLYLGSASGVSGTASTTLIGETTQSSFGSSVSGAGDVNADGFDDVIVGAYGYNLETGRTYVYLGSAAGVAATAATTLTGEAPSGSRFGYAVAGAGDVNGDGSDDVIIGAFRYASQAGRAYLHLGSATGVEAVAGTTLTGAGPLYYLGSALASAGDVNSDGFGDVIVGAYGGLTGRAYVYLGAASGLSGIATTTLVGPGTYEDYYGWAVAGGGDVDGDGHDDVLVGSANADLVHAYLGSASGTSSAVATTLVGVNSSPDLGEAVANAGDVNGDGYDDVIVGSPGYDVASGRAYIYLGTSSGLSGAVSTTLSGDAGSYFGGSVSGAGDVNGDGYDDVIVGARGYNLEAGRAHVFLGSAGGVSATPSTVLTGSTSYTGLGISVSGAGDVNGDGYDDIIVGAYRHSSSRGRADVHLGSAAGISAVAATSIAGEGTSHYFGGSVSGVGDVNGDGYDDVMVGAYGYTSSTGRAYVYLGNPSGVSFPASTTLTGEASSNRLGYSVSGAGDVNGDGFDDVIVGAYGYTSNTGRVYVHLGSAGGVLAAPDTTMTGAATLEFFGASVSDAGDVDGDGFDDVIVGAYGYDASPGHAHLFVGSASGVADTALLVLAGEVAEDRLGHAVSGAGDVDGDGRDEVLVGAPAFDYNAGKVYLHQGYRTPVDDDGDGVAADLDCDDADPELYPGNVEWCDGAPNDCDTLGSWDPSFEDGLVSHLDGDTRTDHTAEFLAGTAAIPAAITLPATGTLHLCDGTWYVKLTASAAGSLSLVGRNGPGATVLSGGHNGVPLKVTGPGVALDVVGLTLADGSAPLTGGGCVRQTAGALSMTDVVVTGCEANRGGGIYVAGGRLSLFDSEVSGNTASGSGGGLYAATPVALVRTNVLGNDAVDGGGLTFDVPSGTMGLVSSLVAGNTATGRGGGLHVANRGTVVCAAPAAVSAGFLGNVAVTGGGGVDLVDAAAVLRSTRCDWGTGPATNNTPSDVRFGVNAYAKGNDATFTCSAGTCP